VSKFKILIVEDDPWYGELLKYHMSQNPDYQVHLCESARCCLDHIHWHPDVICIDYNLPDMKGDVLLQKLMDLRVPVIIISGQKEVSIALNILKQGAYDYIVKDENTKHLLWNAILKIKENKVLKNEVEELKEKLQEKYSFEKTIIGQSDAIKMTFKLIEKAISSNINVLISGETGTGKEVVAHTIHYNSERKKKPFVSINMAAIPKELLESELFGHEKGAFTGAVARRIGKFEEANGGTIFLDEIAEMDINLQVKLLRVLQERELVRIGGQEKVSLNVRVLTATHKNLNDLVKAGQFREDLFYRIYGLPIELPPLRERGTDVMILAKFFIKEYCKSNSIKTIEISEAAKSKLKKYAYPGNVRELKVIIELACVMSDGNVIQEEDISFPSIGEIQINGIEKTMQEYTLDIVQSYLKKYNNNVLLVADKLDISKSTIYNIINKHHIKIK
jgi:two-component system, NtrC family, response regulator AtoC